MIGLMSRNDAQVQQQIEYWDAGAPAYRWIDLINARAVAGQPLPPYSHRVYTYVAQAMYDATIAAWDSKYLPRRLRPSDFNRSLTTVIPNPRSPSYPSEHAVAAGAASAVLAYFFPTQAAFFNAKAE